MLAGSTSLPARRRRETQLAAFPLEHTGLAQEDAYSYRSVIWSAAHAWGSNDVCCTGSYRRSPQPVPGAACGASEPWPAIDRKSACGFADFIPSRGAISFVASGACRSS